MSSRRHPGAPGWAAGLALALALVIPSMALAGQQAPAVELTGRLLEGLPTKVDPTQTYTLYLPSGYTTERQWPALLIFDPRGRSRLAAELFREAAETYGWILIASDNTRSDESMEPNLRALNALWPEVHARVSSDPERIYATGFSGGATVAWLLGVESRELAGVISAGQPYVPEVVEREAGFVHFGAAGVHDFNHHDTRRVARRLEARGVPWRIAFFEGGHAWFPPEVARQAIEWMEVMAIKQGRREPDEALVDRLLAAELAAARRLEAAGEGREALRRYRQIVATYEGLGEVAEAAGRIEALTSDPAVAAALAEERRWDERESRFRAHLAVLAGRLRTSAQPPSAGRIAAELDVEELERKAAEGGYGGAAATRLLENLFTITSFYLTRELFERQAYGRAATALEIATRVRPERPGPWYNYACALARSGKESKALEALERAVDAGYSDLAHLDADPDLEPLRDRQELEAIRARLGGS